MATQFGVVDLIADRLRSRYGSFGERRTIDHDFKVMIYLK